MISATSQSHQPDAFAKTLAIVGAELDRVVIPALIDERAKFTATMLRDLLAFLVICRRDMPALVEKHIAQLLANRSDLSGTSTLLGDIPDMPPDIDRLTSLVQAQIESETADAAGKQFDLASVIVSERRYLEEQERLARAEVSSAYDGVKATETAVTIDRLQKLLDGYRGPGAMGTVTAFAPASGGMSKETFLFEATAPDGTIQRFAVRRDLPFGPGETKVVNEYGLLRALWRGGFRVAEPLWCDGSGESLGQPALLSRRVAGSAGTEPWAQEAATRRAVCLELAELLARLHAIDPAVSGLSCRSDSREQIRGYVLEWQDRWMRHRIHPSPIMAAAFQWSLSHIPRRIERLSIVHSDVSFYNILVADGRITALLDWEFAHIGDPAEDLSYVREHVELLVPWEDFLATYQAAGGAAYPTESARFYEMWRALRNAVTTSIGWVGFVSGAYPAMKMAWQGAIPSRMYLLSVARKLQEFGND
jgi:aminoglycoside phosphotransferase (APT) family kinase protein